MFAFLANMQAAKYDDVTVDGVKYRAITDSTADASIAKEQPVITIVPYVKIKGRTYKVVNITYTELKYQKRESIIAINLPNTLIRLDNLSGTSISSIDIPNSVQEIGSGAFMFCHKLKVVKIPSSVKKMNQNVFYGCSLDEVIIPNSVNKMGSGCFENCKISKLTLPDMEPVFEKHYGTLGKDTEGLGIECTMSTVIRGNSSEKCPQWVIRDFLAMNSIARTNTDFYKNVLAPYKSSFSCFANSKVIAEIESWQKKKEYETTAQWCTRVTEETRKAKVKSCLEELKKEYIKERTSKGIQALIGKYDADYATFPVYMAGLDTVYVKVPQGQAPNFKEHWTDVRLYPKYGVVNDQLALLSCSFKLNGNTYQTLKSYAGDNSADKTKELLANLSPLEIDFSAGQDKKPVNKDTSADNMAAATIKVDYALDKNIPVNPTTNKNTFVVIIGNEDYQRVSKVNYALNDANTFANYCQKTLGIPQQNIRSFCNATYGTMLSALDEIKGIANAYHGNLDVIFYYAGHGVPSEADKNAYLLPVDADGVRTEVCLSTKRLYQTLGELNAKNVVVFMDACFSGAQRGEGMLASARGVALKVKADVPQGNTVVFSAASGEETAFPYKEKGHGMFTYFLLKKLQDTKGDATLGEIGEYVSEEVAKQSIVINHKSQTPTIIASEQIDNWKEIKLKK